MSASWSEELPVLVDLQEGEPPVRGVVRVGWRMERVCEGGPIGPTAELVVVYDDTGQLLAESAVSTPSYHRELLAVLVDAGKNILGQGIYPRLAPFHPDFEVTGLSWPVGGWIHNQAARTRDAVPTAPWLQPEDRR